MKDPWLFGENLFQSYCGIKKYTYLCTRKRERCHSSVGRAKDWKSLCPRFDSWWHHFLRKQNDVNPWISKKFRDFSFPRVSKISGIEANYTSLFKGLFSKARNVPLWGVYFILLQYVALFYITGFSVRFPNFVSLKIEPYGKKKIQRVVLHQA